MSLLLGKNGQVSYEDFTVYSGSALATGLSDGDFTRYLYNPNGTLMDSTMVVIVEMGNGNYRAMFTPGMVGIWYLTVTHSYFPWGKSGTIEVYNCDFDQICVDLKRVLGLSQENVYIDQAHYDSDGNMDSARLRIYSDAVSVGTANNVISEYQISANTIGPCKFSFWKQVKQ